MIDRIQEYWLHTALFLALFIYLIVRAISVPIVHDEAETFFIYIVNGNFLPYQGYVAANNHFLNSFLGHICFKLFGPSLLSIRLPNLLCFPIYFYYVLKISNFLYQKFFNLTFLLAMLTAPFLLEFFALSRGYGMYLGFMMGFFYHFILYFQKHLFSDWVKCQVLLFIGLLASLTIFHIFLISLLIFTIELFLEWKSAGKRPAGKLVLLLTLGYAPAWFFAQYTLYLGSIKDLVVGSLDGFYIVVIYPLVRYLVLADDHWIAGIFVLLFLFAVGEFLQNFWLRRPSWNELLSGNVFHLFLIGSLINIAFLGFVLKIPFPRDRAALFLFPLFVSAVIFSADRIKKFRLPAKIAAGSFVFFPLLLIVQANFTHSLHWTSKRIPDYYYDYILNHQEAPVPATIGSMSLRETCWYYKIFQREQKLSALYIDNHKHDLTTDFKILPANENPDLLQYYNEVFTDAISGNNLYERKHKLKRQSIKTGDFATYSGKDLYHNIAELNCEKLIITDNPLLLETTLDLTSIEVPAEFSLVMEIRNAEGNKIRQQAIRLSRIKYDWAKHELTTLLFPLGMLPNDSDKLLLYVYNNNEAAIKLVSGRFTIYRLLEGGY